VATASDIINGSLRLIGQLAEGETPSYETSNDALVAMNQMLDSWSLERLAVYTTQTQSFSWPANQASRTLGPTGTFVGTRPIQVDDSTYFVDSSGLSFPVTIINEAQYNAIALKTTTSSYPEVLFVQNTNPDTTLTVYPVPTQALTWKIVSVTPLAQPALLSTTLAFPPGYLRAFRYNLACELAPEFGVEPSARVIRIADVSKRNLKRINNPMDVLSIPGTLTGVRGSRFNIFTNQ
jgi:hypothetical protein